MSRPTVRRLWAAVLAVGAVAAATAAQDPPRRPPLDPVAEARARQQVADQRAEADVLTALRDADRQAKTNPVKAAQALKSAQVNIVDLSPALSAETRKTLTDLLARRIAALEGRPLPNPEPVVVGAKPDRKAAYEAYVAEAKAVKEGVDRVARFKAAGLNKDADREIALLAKAYPNNPAVIRLGEQDAFANRVEDSVEFARQQNERITLALNDVMRSSLPAKGDIEFPADWKEKTKRRLKGVELTDAEKKLVEALNKPVTVDWNNRPLDEALQELSNVLDQKLFLDKQSLDALGTDLRKGVTVQANGVAARTVLRQVLAANGLTFVVKDQVLQVVDVEKARNMLTTRVYYLGDLVTGVGPFAGSLTWGPFLDFQQTAANVDTIIKAITSSIDPLSWKDKGGPNSITFHVPSMSLIVRASTEVHASLGSKLGGR
ncbi:MAG: hypothetical protein C0501_08320 [Isosphaera sp.]|nr:hypothetical protein [Isosphaera sp.]